MNQESSLSGERNVRHTRLVLQALMAFLVFSLIGCSQINPAPRDHLVKNLAPIRKIEAEANKLTFVYERLALIGLVTTEDNKKIREHYDVYYIYHKAAVVSLAQGDVQSYNSYVDLAGKELNRIDLKMKFLVQIKPD